MSSPNGAAGRRRLLQKKYEERLFDLEARGLAAQSIPAAEAFTEEEALEYLLMQIIPRRDVSPIAKALLREFGSFKAALEADRKKMLYVPGFSVPASVFFKYVENVGRMLHTPSEEAPNSAAPVRLLSVREAADHCRRVIGGRDKECVLLVLMGEDSRVLSSFFIAEGGETAVGLPAGLIAENAVLAGARGAVIAHNHPSGAVGPSAEDVAATRALAASLAKRGVRLYEHFISSDTECYAMFAEERISFSSGAE